MQYKVVMTDHDYKNLDQYKKDFAEISADFVYLGTSNEDEIYAGVKDADAIITAYAKITARVMDSAGKRLKSVTKSGIGVDNIDIPAATAREIKVLNLPDYCIEEVSDHAFALILALYRRVPQLNNWLRQGNWSFGAYGDTDRLQGKTIGLIGYGRIAKRLHEKVKPFGGQVLVYDPYLDAETIASFGAQKKEFGEVLKESDVISLHVPMTEKTHHLMNAEAFAKMKPTAFLINTSRGPLVNENDLYEAVKNGQILGAGLDVLEKEKVFDLNNPLYSLDMVIITPHTAYNSIQVPDEMRKKSVADIIRVLKGEEPKNQVNR
jgi:D-3-phosphoglycerate dehydrogenase